MIDINSIIMTVSMSMINSIGAAKYCEVSARLAFLVKFAINYKKLFAGSTSKMRAYFINPIYFLA